MPYMQYFQRMVVFAIDQQVGCPIHHPLPCAGYPAKSPHGRLLAKALRGFHYIKVAAMGLRAW